MTVTPKYGVETFQQAIERTLGNPVQIYGCPNSDTYGIREMLPSGCENHYRPDLVGMDHARRDYWPTNNFSPQLGELSVSFFLNVFAPGNTSLQTT